MTGPDFLGLEGLEATDLQRREAQDTERFKVVHDYTRLVFSDWVAQAALKTSELVVQEQFGPDTLAETVSSRQYDLMQANWQAAISLVQADDIDFKTVDAIVDPMLVAEPKAATRYFTEGGSQYRADVTASFRICNLQGVLYAGQLSTDDTPGSYNTHGWYRTDLARMFGMVDKPDVFPLIQQDAVSETDEKYDIASSVANAKRRIADPAISPVTNVLLAVSLADSAMQNNASAVTYTVPNPRLPLEMAFPREYTQRLDSFARKLSATALRAIGIGEQYKLAKSLLAEFEGEVFGSTRTNDYMEKEMYSIKHTYPRKRDRVARGYGPDIADVRAGAARYISTMVEPLAREHLMPLLVGSMVESNLKNTMILNKILHDAAGSQ